MIVIMPVVLQKSLRARMDEEGAKKLHTWRGRNQICRFESASLVHTRCLQLRLFMFGVLVRNSLFQSSRILGGEMRRRGGKRKARARSSSTARAAGLFSRPSYYVLAPSRVRPPTLVSTSNSNTSSSGRKRALTK